MGNEPPFQLVNLKIGENILDFDGSICVITNKTANSIEVFMKRKSEKGY